MSKSQLLLSPIRLLQLPAAGLAIALLTQPIFAQKPDDAATEADMKPYTQDIVGTEITFEMVPIKGGVYKMGSPESEEGREDKEGPQHTVKIEPFWMGKHEVTWDEYDVWSFDLDIQRRELEKQKPTELDKITDAITRPTKPYTDMTFDMGHEGFPAICMTQLAAKVYCEWLTAKTGHYYRLPTEAEWEYACRAGTTTAYSFGDRADDLEEYSWYFDNSPDGYHKIGLKKPNPWGLYDMHGNVAEWVLDGYTEGFYAKCAENQPAVFPLAIPTEEFGRIVRGGGWDDDPEKLRSASRTLSEEWWKEQDPQIPKSVWYHTEALHVGFRVIRPLQKPTEEEITKYQLKPVIPDVARVRERE